MFSLLRILCLAVLLALPAFAQAPDLSRMDIVERSVPAGPVASLDGAPISREAFLFLYGTQVAAVTAVKSKDGVTDIDRINTAISCLSELIQREILASEGAKRKIAVSDAETEKAFNEEIARLQESLTRDGQGSKSEAQILADGGRTKPEALAEMKKALLIEKTREQILKDKGASVSDAEIKRFYDENPNLFQHAAGVHLKQILVRPKPDPATASPASWQEAEQRLNNALARIKAGENFEAVARAVSEAPDKNRGGDIGMIPMDRIPPFFRDAARALQPGEFSAPIRSEYGLHLVQLVARNSEGSVALDKVKDRIRMLLLDRKAEGALEDFCRPIYTNPDRVRVYLKLEDAMAQATAAAKGGTAAPSAKPAPAPAPAPAKEGKSKKKGK